MKTVVSLGGVVVLAGSASAQIVNGSFESGDFSGWVTQDLAVPFWPLSVNPAGAVNTFGWSWSNTPTDGQFDVVTGWDGDGVAGPNPITVAQDTMVNGSTLEFDYRAAWDLALVPAMQDRTFSVEIEPTGGGGALASYLILTATAGTTQPDTGALSAALDVSAFVGQNVRVSFEWLVPETFGGPAQATLDNVRFTPAPGAVALLGLAGTLVMRRRR
jgi:hypothetical protein